MAPLDDAPDHDAGHGHDTDRHDAAKEWDTRYGEKDRHWSGEPNAGLVDEVQAMTPGTAIDLGCGEGADAIWLAANGWTTTGVDVSQVALDRALEASAHAGQDVVWSQVDLTEPADAGHDLGRFDLVNVQYPALPKPAAGAPSPLDRVLAAVAPGGTLLWIGHALTHDAIAHAHDHGFDPADYLGIAEVLAAVTDDPSWTVERHETRPRGGQPASIAVHADDEVLRVRRA